MNGNVQPEMKQPAQEMPPSFEGTIEAQEKHERKIEKMYKETEEWNNLLSGEIDRAPTIAVERGDALTHEESLKLEGLKAKKDEKVGFFKKFLTRKKEIAVAPPSPQPSPQTGEGVPIEVVPEQKAFQGTAQEQMKQLAQVWDTLITKPLSRDEQKLYQKLLSVGDYDKLPQQDREKIDAIEKYSREDYEKMKTGEIPWKTNALWEYQRELRRLMREEKPAETPQATMKQKKTIGAAGVAAAGVVGIAAAYESGEAPTDVGVTEVPEYEEMVMEAATEAPIEARAEEKKETEVKAETQEPKKAPAQEQPPGPEEVTIEGFEEEPATTEETEEKTEKAPSPKFTKKESNALIKMGVTSPLTGLNAKAVRSVKRLLLEYDMKFRLEKGKKTKSRITNDFMEKINAVIKAATLAT